MFSLIPLPLTLSAVTPCNSSDIALCRRLTYPSATYLVRTVIAIARRAFSNQFVFISFALDVPHHPVGPVLMLWISRKTKRTYNYAGFAYTFAYTHAWAACPSN